MDSQEQLPKPDLTSRVFNNSVAKSIRGICSLEVGIYMHGGGDGAIPQRRKEHRSRHLSDKEGEKHWLFGEEDSRQRGESMQSPNPEACSLLS